MPPPFSSSDYSLTSVLTTNSISSSNIINATITGADIANTTITDANIATATITEAKLSQYLQTILSDIETRISNLENP